MSRDSNATAPTEMDTCARMLRCRSIDTATAVCLLRLPQKAPPFLAYGPMTTAYQAMAEQVVASLKAAGVKAVALDLTVGPMHGCYGHPSRADNIAIAAKAKAQIADALGWSWT